MQTSDAPSGTGTGAGHDQEPPQFGPALRAVREQAGRSVEEVSAATRLRPGVLRDLERGELSSCGGPAYARGHVRSIASVLGADPEPLLAALDRDVHAPPRPPLAEAVPLQVARGLSLGATAQVPERRGPRWGGALLAALAVVVVLLAVGVLGGGEPRSATSDDDLLAQAPRVGAPTGGRAAPRAPAPPPARGALLRVRVVEGASWVRVQGSGGTVFEGTLTAGSPPREFRDARALTVLLGNAAAVGVSCAGREVPPSGATGVVRRFTCSAGGLTAA